MTDPRYINRDAFNERTRQLERSNRRWTPVVRVIAVAAYTALALTILVDIARLIGA